ncbi:MAG: hypothetical protein IBJ07_00295 [Rhizobiaceae bacterium]|nr:hypothetical protein [Rhizobiaceae bacterium]
MRTVAALLLSMVGVGHAEIVSEYTDFDADSDCSVHRAAEEGDGDWADLACAGYRGYPVLLSYTDLRETIFYGLPPEGEMPRQPGFHPFNHAGPRIEWRIDRQERGETPFAAIHRWFVAADGEGAADVEILVVSKVSGLEDREGCFVGYVMASGNPNANAAAREIADEKARGFACSTDAPEFSDPSIRDFVSQ